MGVLWINTNEMTPFTHLLWPFVSYSSTTMNSKTTLELIHFHTCTLVEWFSDVSFHSRLFCGFVIWLSLEISNKEQTNEEEKNGATKNTHLQIVDHWLLIRTNQLSCAYLYSVRLMIDYPMGHSSFEHLDCGKVESLHMDLPYWNCFLKHLANLHYYHLSLI